MDVKIQNIIRKQEELISILKEQHTTDQELIAAQEKTIRGQAEKIAILEQEKQKLSEAGAQMAAASEKLEKICFEQQELLDTFSGILTRESKPRQ